MIRQWLAGQDVEQALSYYLAESPHAALGFLDSLEQAFDRIRCHPEAGSSRLAHELDLPGLRSVVLTGYPYQVFYLPGDDAIDLWRVLHMHRDVPELLRE